MKAYVGAVKPLSRKVTSAANGMDVVINVQLGSVHLSFVLILLCTEETGIASHMLHVVEVRWTNQLLFQTCSPKNEARLI